MIACRFGVIEVLPCDATLSDRPLVSGTHVEAVKCDLCAHRANGPACVEVCPTKAISVIDAALFAQAGRKRREHTATAQAAFSPGEYPGQMGA
jgi:electron transport protein HydN